MQNSKSELRKAYSAKRNELQKTAVESAGAEIMSKLHLIPEFKNANLIFSYVSFENEVDTHEIIKKALKSGKRVSVPSINFKKAEMLAAEIKDFSKDLEQDKIGILEPRKETLKPVDISEIDIVLVPGIVFDLHGHRIGTGKGYYDKFLEKMPANAMAIGLAYDFQIIDKVAEEEHDVKMDKIISEKRLIECGDEK